MVLTGILFAIPLCFVLSSYIAELNSRIEFSKKEINGVRLSEHASDLMTHIVSSHELDSESIGSSLRFSLELDGSLPSYDGCDARVGAKDENFRDNYPSFANIWR